MLDVNQATGANSEQPSPASGTYRRASLASELSDELDDVVEKASPESPALSPSKAVPFFGEEKKAQDDESFVVETTPHPSSGKSVRITADGSNGTPGADIEMGIMQKELDQSVRLLSLSTCSSLSYRTTSTTATQSLLSQRTSIFDGIYSLQH